VIEEYRDAAHQALDGRDLLVGVEPVQGDRHVDTLLLHQHPGLVDCPVPAFSLGQFLPPPRPAAVRTGLHARTTPAR
jgi:hypothetical protein